jgi:hypothetical protein
MKPLLSRKFILAVLSLLALFVLCWFKRIDATVFNFGLLGTVGGYLTANVAQKVKTGAAP